jgi:hypothetical protein
MMVIGSVNKRTIICEYSSKQQDLIMSGVQTSSGCHM